MIKKALPWIASHIAVVVIAGLIVWLAIERAHANAENKRLLAEAQKAQDAYAKQLGATKGEVDSERSIEARLAKQNADLAAYVAKMKKQNKQTTVASTSTGTAPIEATVPGKLTPATPTAPAICTDAFNQVVVNTATCEFKMRFKVGVNAVELRGVDGKSRFLKQRVTLIDPVTNLPIPAESADVQIADFSVTEERAAAPGPFHQRLVAAVNERGAFGAGLKFVSVGSFDASLLGFYDRADKSVRGAIQPGYRLVLPAFNSTLSVGPQFYIDSKGKTGFGAGATIELTR